MSLYPDSGSLIYPETGESNNPKDQEELRLIRSFMVDENGHLVRGHLAHDADESGNRHPVWVDQRTGKRNRIETETPLEEDNPQEGR